MNNYEYIIAGLPTLALNFEKNGLDYRQLHDEIVELCSPSDRMLITWLDFGLDAKNLGHHFYYSCHRCKNRFIREYFDFDCLVRKEKVAYLDKSVTGEEFNEKEELLKVFKIENMIEREKALDTLMWNKAESIITFDVLSFNMILAFLVKASIVSRWNLLDTGTGQVLFKKFIDEINSKVKI